jgi:DNA-binding Lrp family transcriptional regulator
MRRPKIDKIDLQILSDLQTHGRMTNVQLSERAGISAPPCLRRVRSLETSGLIKGYHADINSDALGFHVVIFAHVKLNSHAETDLIAFEQMTKDWENVRECHMLAGETDFLLKIVAEDWDDYQKFLTSQLTSSKNVAHVKSSLSIRKSKYLPGPPLANLLQQEAA